MTKTSELTGPALDWAVAKCLYLGKVNPFKLEVIHGKVYRVPATAHANGGWFRLSWEVCGPIIEREEISVQHTGDAAKWRAHVWNDERMDFWPVSYGPTPLIAAMCCYVASKLGDEVDVPEELT